MWSSSSALATHSEVEVIRLSESRIKLHAEVASYRITTAGVVIRPWFASARPARRIYGGR